MKNNRNKYILDNILKKKNILTVDGDGSDQHPIKVNHLQYMNNFCTVSNPNTV